MQHPTSGQLARAKVLIAEHLALRQRLQNLKGLVAAAEARSAAAHQRRFERTDFAGNPAMLAGAISLKRRADAATGALILRNYQLMLADMHDKPPSMGPYPTAKLKVDFHVLPHAARPYLLGPMFTLSIGGKYVLLDLDRSDPDRGVFHYVSTAGPLDPLALRPLVPTIADWFGIPVEWTAYTVNTATLTRRDPMPSKIPFQPSMLRPGALFAGIDTATRTPHHVPLADLSHLLVTGTTGMGKSVGLETIVRSLLGSPRHVAHVFAVDPAGIAFSKFKGTSPRITTLSKPRDLWTLTARLVEVMAEREIELQKTGRSTFEDRFLVLIIDEYPAYNTPDNPDPKSDDAKAHKVFLANVMALGRRARKTGIRLIFVTQEPTDRDIATGIKSVLPGVLAFRIPIENHATGLFGKLEGLPADPRTLPRGRALYRDGTTGEIVAVQFPVFAK